MNVTLLRIDDRLIHGQVMTAWTKVTQASRIVIVDDAVVRDEFMCKVMKMAAPTGMEVLILNLEDGMSTLLEEGDSQSTIVLMKVPATALALKKAGIAMNRLNVGGMGAGPGRKKLFKNISASEEERGILQELDRMGVSVEFRIVPDDKGVPLSKVIK